MRLIRNNKTEQNTNAKIVAIIIFFRLNLSETYPEINEAAIKGIASNKPVKPKENALCVYS